MIRDVVAVEVTGAHRIRIVFEDGLAGEIDVAAMVPFSGVFEELADQNRFARVRVDPDLGTVVWPGGADLDPVVLYEHVENTASRTSPPRHTARTRPRVSRRDP